MKSLAAFFVFMGLCSSAFAAAPSQLFNKSVLVSAAVYTPAIGTDGSRSGSRTIQAVYYVSSQGRVFLRANHVAHQNSRLKQTDEKAPGSKMVQFSGGAIVATVPLVSGAAQVRISFDPSYQTCTCNVIIGGENGKPVTYVGFNGVKFTTTGKPQISNITCSIREGNALAN